ncbi:MAG TPA: glutathione S-transferase [Caulobacteraceae bacterium]|jgi:glutathione S-transferase
MLKLHYAPKTRAFRILWLVEELGQPYELVRHEMGEDDSGYRAIHPHGKFPAIEHDGVPVFESAAICAYLGDAFPAANLGPRIGDPLRGPYLSALAYYAGVIEPAAMSAFKKWEFDRRQAGWVQWPEVEAYIRRTLSAGDYVLGDRFSAADVLMGSAVQVVGFGAGLMAKEPPYTPYLERLAARPAFQRAREIEAAA